MHNMTGYRKRILNGVLSLLIAIFVFSILNVRAYAYDQAYEEAKYLIKNNYVYEVPDSYLDVPTIKDMVKNLNDPYSMYLTAEEYQDFVNRINMEFSGIGVYIDMVAEGVKVISVIDGSPAEDAGLMEGDIITAADGHSLAGLPSDTAVSYIRGEEGSTVNLQVKRDGNIHTYNIVRKIIITPTIRGEMLEGDIAYIGISSFGDTTTQEFRSKLEELKKENPKSFIVDLRNNGGGYLNTAIDLGGNFIGGQSVVLTRDRNNEETVYYSPGSAEVIDKPIMLLVNEYSASASEILAGAIKDYEKAFIVGTKTYGKGSVQSMYQLSDNSVLKLTVQKFYSPNGNVIDKTGITPDFEVDGVDSLSAAYLLSGSSGNSLSKKGFVKVKLGSKEFEIELEKARHAENWEAFRYIIEKCTASVSEVSIGTADGWAKADSEYLSKISKVYYPEYRETAELNDVPVDKKFTVVFNSGVDSSSVDSSTMELVNAATGERMELGFEFVDEKTVKATPTEGLNSGDTYYFVINKGITGKPGSLKEGTVTKVQVK